MQLLWNTQYNNNMQTHKLVIFCFLLFVRTSRSQSSSRRPLIFRSVATTRKSNVARRATILLLFVWTNWKTGMYNITCIVIAPEFYSLIFQSTVSHKQARVLYNPRLQINGRAARAHANEVLLLYLYNIILWVHIYDRRVQCAYYYYCIIWTYIMYIILLYVWCVKTRVYEIYSGEYYIVHYRGYYCSYRTLYTLYLYHNIYLHIWRIRACPFIIYTIYTYNIYRGDFYTSFVLLKLL